MAGDSWVRITGLDDVIEAFRALPDKLRRRVLRNALAVGGRAVRDEARRHAPVLMAARRKAPFRTPGLMRRAISVRTSKLARRAGDVGVFVNVRPAKAADRGARSRRDPFYWRWVNFGKSGFPGVGFLEKGAAKLGQALELIKRAAGPAIDKLNKPKA
jgi:HK97 gp10 family phage protein